MRNLIVKICQSASTEWMPFSSATTYLTTWGADVVITDSGVSATAQPGVISDIPPASSTSDLSSGQGGYALAPQLSMSFVGRCTSSVSGDVALLGDLIASDVVGLTGASVQIGEWNTLTSTLSWAPVTWYLTEPEPDGTDVKFTLATAGALNNSVLGWQA